MHNAIIEGASTSVWSVKSFCTSDWPGSVLSRHGTGTTLAGVLPRTRGSAGVTVTVLPPHRLCSAHIPPGRPPTSSPASSPPRGRCAGSCSWATTGSRHVACSSCLGATERPGTTATHRHVRHGEMEWLIKSQRPNRTLFTSPTSFVFALYLSCFVKFL